MFHHDHRVAGIAQLFERVDQSHIVSLVKTDRGFVENIEHIHQLRTDLGGQSYALALTARKRHGCAVEREVIEAHIEEERKARTDLFQNLRGDSLLLTGELFADSIEPFFQFGHIHCRQLGNVFIAEFIGQRLAIESCAVACRTASRGVELFGPSLRSGCHLGIGHLANVFHHAAEISVIIVGSPHACCGNAQQLGRSVEHGIECFVRQFGHRRVERETILFEHGFDFPKDQYLRVLAEWNECPFLDAEFRIGTYFLTIDHIDHAQPFALGASPLRGVEREIVWRRFAIGQPRHGAHESFGVITHGFIVGIEHKHQAVALRKGLLHALFEALFVLGLHLEFVDHQFDVVVLVAVHAHPGFQ